MFKKNFWFAIFLLIFFFICGSNETVYAMCGFGGTGIPCAGSSTGGELGSSPSPKPYNPPSPQPYNPPAPSQPSKPPVVNHNNWGTSTEPKPYDPNNNNNSGNPGYTTPTTNPGGYSNDDDDDDDDDYGGGSGSSTYCYNETYVSGYACDSKSSVRNWVDNGTCTSYTQEYSGGKCNYCYERTIYQ